MEQWAAGKLGRQKEVQFHCVCVDQAAVAKQFGQIFRFKYARNAWIGRQQDMPTFGQLGCSGFIVVNAKGQVESRKTMSFLDYGPDMAFADVEKVVTGALSKKDEHKRVEPDSQKAEDSGYSTSDKQPQHGYAPGNIVRIEDSDLNIQDNLGQVVKFDTEKMAFLVNVVAKESQNIKTLAFPSCKLQPTELSTSMFPPIAATDDKNGVEDDAQGSKRPKVQDKAILDSVEKPPKVGHDEVDAEHEACTSALNALLQAAKSSDKGASPTFLATVLATLEEHFEHEEELMKDAGMDTVFSALKGHQTDHKRIISCVKEAMTFANSLGYVSLADANTIALRFQQHATQFDVLLEGRLNA